MFSARDKGAGKKHLAARLARGSHPERRRVKGKRFTKTTNRSVHLGGRGVQSI